MRQGDLLFEIDARQLQAQLQQAQGDLAQAQAQLAKAQQDVARFQPLAAQKAISQQELDNALSAQQAAKAAVDAPRAAVDQARLNLGWTRVTSPISGIAGIAQAQVGNLVSPQTVLTTVSDSRSRSASLYPMSEQEYLHYQNDPAMRSADAGADASPTARLPAQGPHRSSPDRDVDVKTGTITIVGLFPNPGNVLRPGQYAKVRAVTAVQTRRAPGAAARGQRAAGRLPGGRGRRGQQGRDPRRSSPARASARLWVIEAGLQPGDRVVVEGFSRVKDGRSRSSPRRRRRKPPTRHLARSAAGAK